MTTVFTRLLETARANSTGVGAFNVVLLEHAEAIVAGAASAGRPVILQISENCARYHGSIAPIVRASQEIARTAGVEALVHLDHITSTDLVREGVDLGVDSVMFDGSHLAYDKNVAVTAEMAQLCHAAGIGVEAEIGEIGGKDGVHAPGVRTAPAEAAQFALATGVDALAVAVGTSHAMHDRTAQVDLELIASIADAVHVPLVLHGSSGLEDAQIAAAVAAGMTKINISTHLNILFTDQVRTALAGGPALSDPRKYVAPARAAVAEAVAHQLRILG